MKRLIVLLFCCLLFNISPVHSEAPEQTDINHMVWKAGVAEVAITPEKSMWLAGYTARDRPSEGTHHEIWVKGLAIEDAGGHQAVLITSDLLGFSKSFSDKIRDRIEMEYGITRAQIILNSSHTHTGPVMEGVITDIYPYDKSQQELITSYTRQLEDWIVNLVGNALQSMEPAKIYAENGVARFAVNRRNNPAETLHQQTELAGPIDHAVPVLKVENSGGEIIAVAFGYACHPTVLNDYKWSGDYPGFTGIELKKSWPDATFLFFQGAGADQNPLPRRTVLLAEQYGKTLAAAVERVLKEDMRPLSSQLKTRYSEVNLQLAEPPAQEDLIQLVEESSGYRNRWANRMLDKIERGEKFRSSYPYPVQVWHLGDQPIVSLGGELVVDYAIAIKRILGQNTFVLGYSNDVMNYIPSTRVLREGGYEGKTAHMVYGLPASWKADIESIIMYEIVKLAETDHR